jgi:hypothetical protein
MVVLGVTEPDADWGHLAARQTLVQDQPASRLPPTVRARLLPSLQW